jgi:hypothetical protein
MQLSLFSTRTIDSMTSISLHPTPSSRTVGTEQFRAVGIALRTEAFFFVGALVLVGVLVISNAVRMMQLHPSGGFHMGFSYNASGAIPIFLLALLVPFGVWRAEDPSRRAYHWSMPVARGPHTIIKLLSGWAWMMIATAVYLLFIILLATVISMITGEPNQIGAASGWEWVAAFTAATIAYLLTSIFVIGSDHAWRWIGGLLIGYWVLLGAFNAFGMSYLSNIIATIFRGQYGLSAALFGTAANVGGGPMHGAAHMAIYERMMSNWLVAMPIWIIGAAAAVAIVSYRHRE